MPHITIEYVIFVPILILQIFLFPLAASISMNIWINSRRELLLETVASRLASSIQQLYFSLNHKSVPAGTVTYDPDVPEYIDNHPYIAEGELLPLAGSESNKRLNITLTLIGLDVKVEASATLGPNVSWDEDSLFLSNSTDAYIQVTKFENCSFFFRFGGG